MNVWSAEPSGDGGVGGAEQDTPPESSMTRKRQRNSSLATGTVHMSDIKKAKLHTPTSSAGGCPEEEEYKLNLPDERNHAPMDSPNHTLPDDVHGTLPNENMFNEVDDTLPTESCSSAREDVTEAAVVDCSSNRTDVSDTDEHNRVESTSPPFTPPSGIKMSGQRKRKRNATYTKDSSEDQDESASVKRHRRATYELSPSSSFIRASDKDSVEGPCDTTVAMERGMSSAGFSEDVAMNDDVEAGGAAMGNGDGEDEEGSQVKDDLMSLLEQRVMDRSEYS